MRLDTQPCRKDCPGRQPGCHGSCEKYLAFYAENRRRNAEKLDVAALDGLKLNAIEKAQKARRLTKGKILRRK